MMNYEIFKEVVKEKFMDYMPEKFKGMEQDDTGSWYINNGKVDYSFSGMALCNKNKWWYCIKNGKLDSS